MKKWIDLASRETSDDTLFDGRLHCVQYRDGYRFSIDPVLLAHFVKLTQKERLLDLGAGCGIIGLILLYRHAEKIEHLTALELQPALLALLRENIALNGFDERMEGVAGDLRTIKKFVQAESCSTVVCNPPFYPAGSGRKSTGEESEIARHQVACSLDEVLAAAAVSVKNRGRVYLIYPAESLGVLLTAAESFRLAAKRMQLVYSYPDRKMAAKMVLLEMVKNGGQGMEILAPLYIYEKKNGSYSEVLQSFYSP